MELYKNNNQDDQLWTDFLSGSDKAYGELYNKHFRLLYNYGCKFTPDKDLVKDSIHDLFVKLWERRKDFNNVNSPKHYLLKAMRHKLLDAVARKKKLIFEQESIPEEKYDFELSYESSLIFHQLSQE